MKKKLSVLVVLILIGLTACSKPAEGTNLTEKKEATVIPGGKEEITSAPAEPGEMDITRKEYGTEKVELEGKALGQLTEKGTDNPYYCNLEENLKMEFGTDETPVYVCKDPVYGITYYVNYGRDNYIYAYRNETSELVVEIPARDLYCKEGELYFIAETDGQHQFSGFAQGNILKYNPVDGSVTVVVDCSADKMIVYPQEICYRQLGEWQGDSRREETLIFSFATGESSAMPIGTSGTRKWNGYWLHKIEEVKTYSESDPIMQDPLIQELLAQGYTFGEGTGIMKEIQLKDAQGNVVETLQNTGGIPRDHLIYGDYIYYVEQQKEEADERSILRRYNMQTGTQEDIVVLGQLIDLSITDMIIHKKEIYFDNGLRVDPDTGAQCLMQYAGEGLSPQIKYFYTDGETMFCISEGKLWLFEEQPGNFVITRELVAGVPLEIGTYTYRLVEP
ncbi:MAG: hypothetical protein J6J44_14225 [Lachnospiraceae bacterium]|nr:hypothetical protein [Lachnospiraceae bacterium]